MSRFVSAGADEAAPNEEDEKWLAAQKAIEATRSKPRVQAGSQEGGKSLFETLEANKAAKQDAFEQSMRLGNQFQALDDDDVEFLDSVLQSERQKEAEVKRETREQLEAFRQQQQDAERLAGKAGAPTDTAVEETTAWKVGGRKRKKGAEGLLGGVKLRKSSSTAADKKKPKDAEESAAGTSTGMDDTAVTAKPSDPAGPTAAPSVTAAGKEQDEPGPTASTSASPPATGLGGLVAYGSSGEDD